LLNALGAMVAAVVLGQLMTLFGATALFWSFASLCLVFAVYIYLQLRVARAIPVEEQTPFSAAVSETAPSGFELDPRGEE
jgi:uncharacterized membrane protein YfcA